MAKSNRSATGQFTKGSGGRPRGAKNKRKTYTPAEFSASVTAAATAKLEDMTDKALDVIEQQLDKGDARTAIWVLDRCLPSTQHKLAEAIPGADLSSLEGIIETAQTAAQMAAAGRMELETASRVLTILTNTANLLGYHRIGELREMVEEFEQQGAQGVAGVPAAMVPIWGRLEERMKQ